MREKIKNLKYNFYIIYDKINYVEEKTKKRTAK
jgi:hypothetical protein